MCGAHVPYYNAPQQVLGGPFPTEGNQKLLDDEGKLPPQYSPTDPSEKMKRSLNVPELLDDAVPSTIAQKMVNLVPMMSMFTCASVKIIQSPKEFKGYDNHYVFKQRKRYNVLSPKIHAKQKPTWTISRRYQMTFSSPSSKDLHREAGG